MKKTIIFAAIACVALASCVKNERVVSSPTKGETEIAFTALSYKTATKADVGSITTATYPTAEKFDVWSVFSQNVLTFADLATASNYADYIGTGGGAGAAFASDGTAPNMYWKGDGTAYYWPRAGKLSFVAFSPASVDPTYTWTTQTFAKSAYSVNQSKDLMYSDITPNKTRNDYTVNNPVLPYDDNPASGDTGFDDYKGVNILFHHAQSLVQFKVVKQNTADNEIITVTGISLLNPYTTADLAVTHNNFNDATVTWSNGVETANVVFTTGQTVVVPTGTAVNVPASAGVAAAGGTTNDFIVLPQPLDHSLNKVQVAITFTSTVGTPAVTSDPTTLNINLSDGQISAAGDHTEWLPNKRYIYTIKFVGTEIILDPKVVAYDDPDINVTLPDLAAY